MFILVIPSVTANFVRNLSDPGQKGMHFRLYYSQDLVFRKYILCGMSKILFELHYPWSHVAYLVSLWKLF